VDGFNLYHAIADLGLNHLKWVDLWKLMEHFQDPTHHEIVSVHYFSAYATWLPDAHKRHRAYVAALKAVGVTSVMARFKQKERHCARCKSRWIAHEEKESDVNIALRIISGAYQNRYDRAHIVTGDSDLVPAVKDLKSDFPQKQIRVILPPKRICHDLAHTAGKKSVNTILPLHLERSLLPQKVFDSNGRLAATRPPEYSLPR